MIRRRPFPRFATLLAAALIALPAFMPRANAAVMVDCPFNNGGGDFLDRGFYITSYDGATLKSVRLAHRTVGAEGPRTIQLSARLDNYGGVLLGTASVTRVIRTDFSISNFDFGDVAVPAGATITFRQTVTAGIDDLAYNTGEEPCGVTQTNGTSAPLDSFRRGSVGVVIDGSARTAGVTTLLSCPFEPGSGGDNPGRGFYVENYPGTTLDTVTVRYNGSGATEIELQARLERFDGPIVGTVNVIPNLTTSAEVVFPFGNAPVPAGSRIVFLQRQISGTAAFLQVGFPTLEDGASDTTTCPGVIETSGTTPPISSIRRGGVSMKVTGRVASSSAVPAVEYFHSGFLHYFMTAQADEIAGLDGGAFGGVFTRTGAQFFVRDGPLGVVVPVCRFFTVTFAPKSSHFYTADAAECALVKTNPDWQYEKIAFYAALPVGGVCAAGTIPVYRAYNNGQTGAPNHRFTTSLAVYTDFTTNQGWAPEGIRFCVPIPV